MIFYKIYIFSEASEKKSIFFLCYIILYVVKIVVCVQCIHCPQKTALSTQHPAPAPVHGAVPAGSDLLPQGLPAGGQPGPA